jgi:LytS/YehU family sensor histidine kinase
MESRLAVVPARVEPELLFAVLADVQRLYVRERTSGDRLLDDLIAYLRSALPEMRGGISTLGREIALMQTYLRILPAGRSGRLEASSSVAAGQADQAFPPMLLLMLAQAAAEAGARHVRVEDAVESAGDRCGVVVATDLAQPPPGWASATLEPLRGVVRHWFGPDATLTVDCDASASRASIAWSRATPAPCAAG